MTNTREKFWERVDQSAGPEACWPWLGYVNPRGYGMFKIGGRQWLAHRFMYTLTHGEIPEGRHLVDHTCHVTECANPAHLRLVSQMVNIQNRAGAAANNKASGVRNVYASGDRWRVQVFADGHLYYGGTFLTIAEAAEAAAALRERVMPGVVTPNLNTKRAA